MFFSFSSVVICTILLPSHFSITDEPLDGGKVSIISMIISFNISVQVLFVILHKLFKKLL